MTFVAWHIPHYTTPVFLQRVYLSHKMAMNLKWPFLFALLLVTSFLSEGTLGFAFSPKRLSCSVLKQRYSREHQLSQCCPYKHLVRTTIYRQADFSVLFSQPQEESTENLSTPLDSPALAVLDIVALTGFAAVGKASHAPDGSIDLAAVFVTAFPFITAWLAVSPLTGVYKELEKDDDDNVVKAASFQTVKGWAVAVPLGCAVRGVFKGYVPPLPFVIVTLVSTLVILCAVRVVYALVTEQKQ